MREHELQPVLHRSPTPDSSVLTIYLDVDQSKQQNRNHGFVTALRGLLRDVEESLETDDRETFRTDARQALRLVESHQDRKSVV